MNCELFDVSFVARRLAGAAKTSASVEPATGSP